MWGKALFSGLHALVFAAENVAQIYILKIKTKFLIGYIVFYVLFNRILSIKRDGLWWIYCSECF